MKHAHAYGCQKLNTNNFSSRRQECLSVFNDIPVVPNAVAVAYKINIDIKARFRVACHKYAKVK